jgi:hypothetical protein
MSDYKKEKRKEYDRKYQEKNKDKIREYHAEYRSRPEVKEKRRLYRQENKAKIRENAKKHRESAQYDPERFVGYLFEQVKGGASSRNILFEITKEDITRLCIDSKGKCAISGMPLTTYFNSPFKASVDRIDSSLGYTTDNVQLVATMVNTAKNKYSMEEFLEMCKAVVEYNK